MLLCPSSAHIQELSSSVSSRACLQGADILFRSGTVGFVEVAAILGLITILVGKKTYVTLSHYP